MVSKRGRKRKNDLYFGPEEEQAVVKYLEFREIKTVDLVRGKPLKLEHNLGKNISINASYIIPNEKAYGSDSKTLEIELPLFSEEYTDTSVVITSDVSVNDVTVIVMDVVNSNLIFNEYLKEPLNKMIESIIRRYRLYRKTESYEDLHGDTLSFLMTKVSKFDCGKGKKAYSYFGTIVKNYIVGHLIKDEKILKKVASYEDVSNEVENREDLTYVIDSDKMSMDVFFKKIIESIKLELMDENVSPKKKLNENERKVGNALVEIFENWESIFDSLNGGSKYNKNSVLDTMRNYTHLSTKDIRLGMKRYKKIYETLKQFGV